MSEQVNGQRIRRSKADWLALFEQQDQSGLSQLQFCKQHHIAVGAFYNARCRFARQSPVESPVRSPQDEFLSLTLPCPSGPVGWDIELSLGGEVVLRIRRP